MFRRIFSTTLLALFVVGCVASISVWAGDRTCNSCPKCQYKVCEPSPEVKQEKKTTYDFECKEICIPGIRWPWQPCCEPSCGKVRTVKVLKKYEQVCEKCGTKWTVTDCGPCGK